LDSQSDYGCSFLPNQVSPRFLKLLNLLKVLNFKQHLRLLKRKTNWHAADNVGYCPTLPLSAIRHIRPPHVYRRNHS